MSTLFLFFTFQPQKNDDDKNLFFSQEIEIQDERQNCRKRKKVGSHAASDRANVKGGKVRQ